MTTPAENKTKILKLITTLVLGCLSVQSNLKAQDSSYIVWDPPQQISADTFSSVAPQLVAVGDTVHLMWTTSDGPDGYYARSTDAGANWIVQGAFIDTPYTNRTYISAAESYAYIFSSRCELPCTLGNIHYVVDLRRSLDAGSTWLPRVTIASDSGIQNLSEFTSARDSTVGFINLRTWTINLPRFAWSSERGSTWNFYDASTQVFDRFVILADGIHLVRELGQLNTVEVAYTYSSDFGVNWTTPYFLSSIDTLLADEQDIAGDDAGLLCAVWRDAKYGSIGGFGASIIFRRSTDFGSTWLEEQLLTTQPVGILPRVAVEGDFVGVIWDDDQTGNLEFRLSTDGGNSFLPEETLAFGGDGVIAIKNSWIHTAWFASATNSEIFYRRGRIVSTSTVAESPSLPTRFALHQNYPNPFNPTTTIKYDLPTDSPVSLKVYDVLGREVLNLVDGVETVGHHQVTLNAAALSSGVYFYRLKAGDFTDTKRLLLLK